MFAFFGFGGEASKDSGASSPVPGGGKAKTNKKKANKKKKKAANGGAPAGGATTQSGPEDSEGDSDDDDALGALAAPAPASAPVAAPVDADFGLLSNPIQQTGASPALKSTATKRIDPFCAAPTFPPFPFTHASFPSPLLPLF